MKYIYWSIIFGTHSLLFWYKLNSNLYSCPTCECSNLYPPANYWLVFFWICCLGLIYFVVKKLLQTEYWKYGLKIYRLCMVIFIVLAAVYYYSGGFVHALSCESCDSYCARWFSTQDNLEDVIFYNLDLFIWEYFFIYWYIVMELIHKFTRKIVTNA